MVFGLMSIRKSLSDLAIIPQSQPSKWDHLGIGATISNSNLSRAKENRDWRIYLEYDCILIAKEGQMISVQKALEFKVDGNVYSVDSTTMNECLSVFC